MPEAHDTAVTHTYHLHYPRHEPRTSDPHYPLFNAYRRAHIADAACQVGARGPKFLADCKGGLQLHHRVIEFAMQNEVDLETFAVDYAGVTTQDQLMAWAESDPNFEFLCLTPESLVLMADGSERAIEDVGKGEAVIGHDGRPHVVTATGRRRYRGEIVRAATGVGLTLKHPVLTMAGWRSAGWVFGAQVIPVRGVESEVARPIVGALPVDVMNPLARLEWSPEYSLHDKPMFHDQAITVPHAAVSGRGHAGSSAADVPLRQLVQSGQSTRIGTVAGTVGSPVRAPRKGVAAVLAAEGRRLEWLSVDKPVRSSFSGWVHDISVAHSHSFIAGGLAVHNCEFHHIGHAGVHVMSASDWSNGQYIPGLAS